MKNRGSVRGTKRAGCLLSAQAAHQARRGHPCGSGIRFHRRSVPCRGGSASNANSPRGLVERQPEPLLSLGRRRREPLPASARGQRRILSSSAGAFAYYLAGEQHALCPRGSLATPPYSGHVSLLTSSLARPILDITPVAPASGEKGVAAGKIARCRDSSNMIGLGCQCRCMCNGSGLGSFKLVTW